MQNKPPAEVLTGGFFLLGQLCLLALELLRMLSFQVDEHRLDVLADAWPFEFQIQ